MEKNVQNTLAFLPVEHCGADDRNQCFVPTQGESVPISSADSEENLLWIKFKSGDENAFSEIYNRYIFSLFNYGEWITHDKELIEDSIHDLFVDLWRNRQSTSSVYSIKFYLYKGLKRKIVRNLLIKKRVPLDDFTQTHGIQIALSHEFDLINKEISQEQKGKLLKAINSLTERQKKAVILKFYDGLSYVEIAKLLSISVKSTYTLVYRAIDILKLRLETELIR